MVDAEVEAAVRNLLLQQWRTQIDSARLVSVDPASVRANFANPACRVADLEWFANRRTVVISGLMADTFKITMGSLADSEQRARLAAAIEKLNTELELSIRRATTTEEELSFINSRVFFGARTTELRTDRCEETISLTLRASDQVSRDVCRGRYAVTVASSHGSQRLTINIHVPAEGIQTGELDIAANSSSAHALGEIRLVSLFPQEQRSPGSDRRIRLRITVLQVGAAGS